MPEFTLEASNEFWKNFSDPMIYRVIAFMESVENFTLDGDPAIEKTMKRLGDAFEDLNSFTLDKEDKFVALSAHLKSSRILHLLQTIDTIDPGSASRLLMYSEENNNPAHPLAELFLRRNIAFERLRLLGRIFSEERIKLLLDILEEDQF